MKEIEYRTRDKSVWGDGPWQNEPDKKQFTDPATGLPCLIVRNPVGALCGYVGVDEGHPWFGFHYDHPELLDITVRGGLTFSAACNPDADESSGICHKPAPGEPDHVWWFGFDCAHAGDRMPYCAVLFGDNELFRDDRYRTIDYVTCEIADLAAQLSRIAPTAGSAP